MAINMEDEQRGWDEVESMMDSVLASSPGEADAGDRSLAQAGVDSLLDTLAREDGRLRSQSAEITAALSARVDDERAALRHESDDVASRLLAVESLEAEAEELRRTGEGMRERRRRAEEMIPRHVAAAAEVVDAASDLEARQVRAVPKIRAELMLHSKITNIKWAYGGAGDMLAGEVALPRKKVHMQFEVRRGSRSEVEVADELWSIIEG